jgi:hypothetical protein
MDLRGRFPVRELQFNAKVPCHTVDERAVNRRAVVGRGDDAVTASAAVVA